MSWVKQLVILAVLGALGIAAWAGLGGFSQLQATSAGTEQGRPDAQAGHGATPGPGSGGALRSVLVAAEPVVPFAVAESVRAVGTAQATRAITVYPRADGQVVEILAESGARVSAGDPLVRLDDDEERIALERAAAAAERARATADRYARLGNSSGISQAEIDQVRADLRSAEADLAAAQLALARRTVPAPFGGVLGIVEVERGEHITTATPIVTLDDRSVLLVNFHVPERYAGMIETGQTVRVTTDAYRDEVFQGEITAVDSRVDATVRTLRLRAAVDNEADRLRPGLTFAVELDLEGEEHTAVPELSVQWNRRGAFVWRLDGDVVRQTPIEIIERAGGMVAVSGPLELGDQVVIGGTQRLSEGWPVRVAPGDGAAPRP